MLPEYNRLKVNMERFSPQDTTTWNRTTEAEVVDTGQSIELLYDEGNIEIIGVRYSERSLQEWLGKRIKITDKDSPQINSIYQIYPSREPGNVFRPFRQMTISPNLFMAIVPADRAVDITDLIYREYINRFGKVMGRLPFSIGNIFFGSKIPMFVVLDAGKRMIANFDKLGKGKKDFTVSPKDEKTADGIKFDIKCKIENGFERSLTWQLPYKLGSCKPDYHHPYFTVKEGKDCSSRTNYFKTVAGDVIHFTEVKPDDVLELYPNYYDFEFLDYNARRYDVGIDKKGRRKSNVADFTSKPFLLDELDQKIVHIWEDLLKGKQLKGITDTKLRNLQSLWLTKYQEWVREPDMEKGFKQWKEFVKISMENEFELSKESKELNSLMDETIESGLFFDTLELYLGILKERVEE